MDSGCWVYYLSNALILYFLIALGASLFTAGIGALAVYVWVGTFARRRRWDQLSWRDFEQFIFGQVLVNLLMTTKQPEWRASMEGSRAFVSATGPK